MSATIIRIMSFGDGKKCEGKSTSLNLKEAFMKSFSFTPLQDPL